MAYPNVTQLISDINRKVSPGNVSQSRDIMGAIAEASRRLLTFVKPKELSRRALVENALYDQVLQFKCPPDMDEKKVMQWYKLKDNRGVDTFYYPMFLATNRAFDQGRAGYGQMGGTSSGGGWGGNNGRNVFTIEWQSGVKFIRVSNFTGNTGLTLSQMDTVTQDGTWNVFGNVTNITTDDLTYVSGSGSIRFDINTSSSAGGIYNFGITPVNLTEFLTVGKIFTWLDLPNLNQVQTITLDLFTNASNFTTDYYSITVNSPHDSPTFQLGQNMLGFPFDINGGMTEIGLPNPGTIVGLRFTIITNGTLLMNSVRMDNVVARKGAVYGIQYISSYVFEDAQSNVWKENPTVGSDIIHLIPETYNLLINEAAYIVGQELFTGSDGLNELSVLRKTRDDDMKMYKKMNKSEYIDEQQQLYAFGVPYGYYGNGLNSGNWDSNNR